MLLRSCVSSFCLNILCEAIVIRFKMKILKTFFCIIFSVFMLVDAESANWELFQNVREKSIIIKVNKKTLLAAYCNHWYSYYSVCVIKYPTYSKLLPFLIYKSCFQNVSQIYKCFQRLYNVDVCPLVNEGRTKRVIFNLIKCHMRHLAHDIEPIFGGDQSSSQVTDSPNMSFDPFMNSIWRSEN
jgi:hypothetical protein